MTTVLYLNPSAALGGAERSLLGLVTHLPKTRFRPVVAVPHSGPLVEELLQRGIRTVCVPPGRWALRLSRKRPLLSLFTVALAVPGLLLTSIRLVRLIRREKVLLLHTNGLKSHILGGIIGHWTGRPVICHLRDLMGSRWIERRLLGWIRKMATHIVVPSEAVAESLRTTGGSPVPVTVIPNGIEPIPSEEGHSVPLFGNGVRVGIVGPLVPRKGHDIFLRAARHVLREIPSARFFIVGDEIYETWGHHGFRQNLKRLAQALGIADRVTFTGFVPNPFPWIQAFDLIVSAAVEPEGFGRVLLEAMAAGKPVVATRLGATPELVQDGVTGLLVRPSDPEALAEGICRILKDSGLRRRLGQAGKESVPARYSIESHVRSMEQLYGGLC